jgi:hypothetical protein
MSKLMIVAELRDLHSQYKDNEITYSRMAELINEKADEWFDKRLKDPKIGLVNLVDPEKEYCVSYTINQSGDRTYGDFTLLGKDLTENQIVECFKNGHLLKISAE